MHIARRHLLFAAAPAALLAGCTVTTSNGTTTVTLDTARIQQDGQAVLTAAAQILATPGISAALGGSLLTAQQALASANTAFSSVTAQIGASVSVSLDTTSVQNGIKSVLSDVQTILGLVQPVLSLIPGGAAVGAVVAAIQALLPFLTLAAALAPVATQSALDPAAETNALHTIYGR